MTNNTNTNNNASFTPTLGWHYARLEFSSCHPERMAQFALTEICRDRKMRVDSGHWPDMILVSQGEACEWLRDAGWDNVIEINHVLENLEIDKLISIP